MNKISKIIILVFVVSLFGALGFSILTEAGSGDNVSGFAWSENIGWVSFNSTSDGSSVSYGVNLDLGSGNLSGEAWSENIGWISFNRSDTGNPPAAPFNGGSGPIAQYNFGTNRVTGWMRVLAYDGGWDGWIRFCDSTIANCSGAGQVARIDPATGDWHGWTWSDMVVGWLSLNSSDSGAGGSAYKVTMAGGINRPPSAINLSTTASVTDYCSKSPANIFLNWEFSDLDTGHTQSAYQIQVTRVNDGQAYDSGKISESASSITAYNINSDMGGLFIWYDSSQQGYTWRVKVWDSQDAESDWSDGPLFRTPLHQYPSIDFSWQPSNPSQGEDVQFTDESTCYDTDGNCDSWSWTIPNATYIGGTTSSSRNPRVKFTSDGSKQVFLKVTDSDTYFCQVPISVEVQVKLPGWEEVLPQ